MTFAPDELNKEQKFFSPGVVHGTSIDQVMQDRPTGILRRQYLLNDALSRTSRIIRPTLVSRVQFGMGGSEASYTNPEVEKEVTWSRTRGGLVLVCHVCEHFEVCVGRFEVKIVEILSA